MTGSGAKIGVAGADALNKHRGKGQQKVTVEHVHVHSGGQAVVGMVATPAGQPGGWERTKLEDQPHSKPIAHAPQFPLPRPDTVPAPRDDQRPLPDARRQVTGRAKGQ